MINKEVVKTLVDEWLQQGDYFLVDIIFGADDRIVIEIDHADGVKLKGVMKEVDGRTFVVTVKEKQVVEGKKRPVMADVDKTFSMDEVKSVKYLLAFK